ncbi:CidA/LrgA family protein [Alteromonas gilva]|uniref:CidA/LrgA family protein n=1 Tax=Alteromonas gilva TaxID=2987522 RepID=A0ABT5KZV6_9ALTE|nr:CidA/LrgA family protein [Alteromonas gilva]MDC8830162.1 CidA/LrgA family protein [Alteromonas gilva]
MQQLTASMAGWLVIIACYLVGEFLVLVFNAPVPGALAGLLILLTILLLRQRSTPAISRAAQPLLTHMSVLFVPAVIGVGLFWDIVLSNVLGITLALVVTTVVSLGLTGWVAQWLLDKRGQN